MINILKNYFTKKKTSESITQSAILIAFMGLASRLLGLVRDRIFADKFGAGDITDIYNAAFKVPDLIYSLLVLGALSAAFVPVFTSLTARKKENQAWNLVNVMISVGVVVLAVVSIIIFIFAPQLVSLITFGYSADKQAAVAELTRIMLLSPIILGISGIIGGVLNSFKRFFFYSLAPVFYNLGIICGAYYFYDFWGTKGLAVGVILGAVMHLLVQIPMARSCGFKFEFLFTPQNKYFLRVIKLMIPRSLGLAITQINLLVVTILSSTLGTGSLAVFTFANNLQSVPLGLFGISFAVAAFPTLSCLWSQGHKNQFRTRFANTLSKILFFIIPTSALIFVLRAQIVRVVLGTGSFDWEDTVLTLQALGIFTVSLWAQACIPLLARAFYVIHDTKTPFFIGLFSEAVNVGLALLLIKEFGILGLVAAFSASTIVNAVALGLILRFKIGGLAEHKITKEAIKVAAATTIMVLTVQVVKEIVGDDLFGPTHTFLGVFAQLFISILQGGLMFYLAARALNIKQMNHFLAVAHKKVFRPRTIENAAREEVGS